MHLLYECRFHKIISICLFILSLAPYTFASEYDADISFAGERLTLYDNEKIIIPLTVKNTGTKTWDSFALKNPVSLSYHLISRKSGIQLKYDNIRTPLQQKVHPGETLSVRLQLLPLSVGEYIIRIDLVAEGLTWFKERGSREFDVLLNIIESQKKIAKPKLEFEKYSPELLWYIDGEQEINYCSVLSQNTLEGNFQEFTYNNEPIYGFVAGNGYPQIWIRDSATIMPISRYTYPTPALISWITAHLNLQKRSGELQDWIATNNKFDKNTVESDQESSLVIASYEISKTIGYNWLFNDINSKSILLRLHDALRFIFIQRLDSQTGLIKSGHTADWGDVSNEFSDKRAVDLQPDSAEVVGIYTNALAYGAATRLSFLFAQAGDKNKSLYWNKESVTLRGNIQRFLWQKDKGFFRTHKHVTSATHENFDEDNIFPMGGNAVAIEMGVTKESQIDGIINQALLRQKLFNFSTISGVLLPPYPKDFFKHPALDDYFEYQNGGQWDWFGGRLVLQMFNSKHPLALDKLRELCDKAFLNNGFYEWDTMDGKGRGSSYYSGSAAAIYRAMIEGFFGIDWGYKSIRIKPYLSKGNAYIYIPQAVGKKFLSYSLQVLKNDNKIIVKLSFGSNVKCNKTLILPRTYDEYSYYSTEVNRNITQGRIISNVVEIDLVDGKNELLIEYR